MLLNRQKFLDALLCLHKAVTPQEMIEQSDCFVFDNGHIYAFNGEVAIIVFFDHKFKGAVKAKELLQFLSKIKEENIKVKQKETELVVIGKKKKAGFNIERSIEMPLDEIKPPKKWQKLPENFNEAIQACSVTCARTTDRPALFCIYLKDDKAYGCDSVQATRFTFDKKFFEKDILVPFFATKVMVTFSFIQYSSDNGWIYFKNDEGVILCSRSFEEQYPDIEAVINNNKGDSIQFPTNLKEVLNRSSIFAEQVSMIEIDISEKEIVFKSQNDNGWLKEKAKTKGYSGEPITLNVNPILMAKAANLTKKVIVSKNSIRFDINDNYVYIVAVMAK